MSDDNGIDIKKGLGWTLFLIGALILIAVVLNNYALNPQISEDYTRFYQNNLNYSAWGAFILLIGFNIIKEAKIGGVLGIGMKTKLLIFFGFTAVIMFMTISGGQIVGVPTAQIEGFTLTQSDEFMTSAVIPGFVEDPIYLIVIPTLALVIMLIAVEKVGFDVTRTVVIIAILLSAMIGGTIFTSAHVQAYGELKEAYLGAWMFGTGQSAVYMTTGIFMPLAHVLHNAYIALGDLYSINFGGFQVV